MLEVKELYVKFGDVDVLKNVNMTAEKDEFVCILGPSGCGKTTLLNTIAGFVRPSYGRVLIDGKEVKSAGVDRGYVFQQHSLFPWKTVFGNIEFGLRMKGVMRGQRRYIVEEYAQAVGLSDFLDFYPKQLSGGMQQRVALARAFANDPDILLMDEPFASLDAQISYKMQMLLNKVWGQRPKTVVFVTHNIDEAMLLADKVVVLTARPARLKQTLPIEIDRPRTYESFEDRRYVKLRKRLMGFIFGLDMPGYR